MYKVQKIRNFPKNKMFASVCSSPGEEERKNSLLKMWLTLLTHQWIVLADTMVKSMISEQAEATQPCLVSISPPAPPLHPALGNLDLGSLTGVLPLLCSCMDVPNFVLHCKHWMEHLPGASKHYTTSAQKQSNNFFLKKRSDGLTFGPGFRLST